MVAFSSLSASERVHTGHCGQEMVQVKSSVRNKEKISLVRRTSNFENLLVRQSQHLSKQFPRNEAHGLALG